MSTWRLFISEKAERERIRKAMSRKKKKGLLGLNCKVVKGFEL